MADASPLQLSPSVLGVIQWTLVGIEVLVLAYVVAWIARNSRLGRLARPFRRRTTVSESTVDVGVARETRLVSGGGTAPTPLHVEHGERTPMRVAPRSPRTPRALRLTRTPARGDDAVVAGLAPQVPATLHCPGCGTLLVRGELASRLVTRCAGCERRVAVRMDGARVVVTLEG